jgi:outer membrane immunogenic protein
MKKLLGTLALSIAPIVAVHADTYYVQSGTYITADGGYGYLFTPNSDQNAPTTGGSYNHGGAAGSIGLGYRWAMDSFTSLGLEADYLYNGKATYDNDAATVGSTSYDGTATFTSQGGALMAVFSTIWENNINLFGKAGVVYVSQKQSYSDPTVVAGTVVSGSDTAHGVEFIGVLGLGYMLTQSVNLFIDGTYTSGGSGGSWTSTSNTDFNIVQTAQLKAGLSYYF